MVALLLINLQVDFCAGGALETPHSDAVLDVAKDLIPAFYYVVAAREWHPANHLSFAAMHLWRKPGQRIQYQGKELNLWPMHCIQGSFGAEFAPGLPTDAFTKVFSMGTEAEVDQFSAFSDAGQPNSTGLFHFLKEKHITTLYLLGLGSDNTLKNTALEALQLGFKPILINAIPKTEEKNPILDELEAAGITILGKNV